MKSPLGSFLDGVRILDLSQYIPGPMATLLLQDMGALVVKIEPPAGDQMAELGPRDRDGEPVFYNSLNAGKSVRRLNLKTEAGRQEFFDLVVEADVVVEGFRPGVLDRLQIPYRRMQQVNPSIILCSISGYGATSTRAAEVGHDANFLALSGMMHRNGQARPLFYDPPIGDVAGALFAGLSIVGALNRKLRTGRGCEIDIALADTLMPLQLMQLAGMGENGVVPQARATYLNGGAAYYNVYETADGKHFVLCAVEAKFWRNFCAAARRPDWLERNSDPMPQGGLQNEIAAFFATMKSEEIIQRFMSTDSCISEVLDLAVAEAQHTSGGRSIVRRTESQALQALFPAWVNGLPPAQRADGPVAGSGWSDPGDSTAPKTRAIQSDKIVWDTVK